MSFLRRLLKSVAAVDTLYTPLTGLVAGGKLRVFGSTLSMVSSGSRLTIGSVRAVRRTRIREAGIRNSVLISGEVENCQISILGSGNRLVIESGASIKWTELSIVSDNSEIFIASGTTIGGKESKPNLILARGEPSRVLLGTDCMLSYGIEIRTSDSHSIFDGNGVKLNPSADIIVGAHVWIASNSTVLKGCSIDSGAVVATASVVTRSIPKNCIAAGIPSKILKENIRWAR